MTAKVKATDEQKEQVQEQASTVEEQAPQLEQLAGLFTIETKLNQQLINPLKLADEDKGLVTSALTVLAEVIDRKVTNESTKRYLGLLLVFIRSALAV